MLKVFAILALLLAACANERGAHFVSPTTTAATPATLPLIQQRLDRLEQRASSIGASARIPRTALFDAAWPASQAEFDATGHSILVLVIALSQDAAELPLRAVYSAGPGDPHPLRRIGTIPAAALSGLRIPPSLGRVAWAGLYQLANAKAHEVPLAVDFARGRTGFVIGEPDWHDLDALDGTRPADALPEAIAAMASREFPEVALSAD